MESHEFIWIHSSQLISIESSWENEILPLQKIEGKDPEARFHLPSKLQARKTLS